VSHTAQIADLDPETDETKFDVIHDLKVVILAYQLLELLGETNVLNTANRTHQQSIK